MRTNKVPATIGLRIQQLLQGSGMNQADLARAIDIKSSSMSNIINDKARPSAETLFKIAAALRANPIWILRGEGHPYEMRQITDATETDLLDGYRSLPEDQKAAVLAVIETLRKKP